MVALLTAINLPVVVLAFAIVALAISAGAPLLPRKRRKVGREGVQAPSFALLFALLAVTCVGVSCASRGDAAGRYVSDQDSRDSAELRADGTFTIREDGGAVTGTYTVSGTEVHLETRSGQALGGRIENGGFTDGLGKHWTKQSGPSNGGS